MIIIIEINHFHSSANRTFLGAPAEHAATSRQQEPIQTGEGHLGHEASGRLHVGLVVLQETEAGLACLLPLSTLVVEA